MVRMKKRSLHFKMMLGGVMITLVPLLVVGIIALYKAMANLEDVSKSQSLEIAKGLANMANLVLQGELKTINQLAVRDVVVSAAGTQNDAASEKATAELTKFVLSSEGMYETVSIAGLDGKVFADGVNGKHKGIDLSDREYFKVAKDGKATVGSVTKSKGTGNVVMTFASPVYSEAKQLSGVIVSVLNISFLEEKVSKTKLGSTGYGFVLDKTGLCIAHPNKDFILKINPTQVEGMKHFAARMVAGETGAEGYVFKEVKKLAGFAPVPAAGWSVGVTQDYSEFMAPAYNIAIIIILIGLIFLGIAVAAVYVFSRSISLPIVRVAKDLNDASEQVAAASTQVASASQSLAEGASEQASALEETSSSLEEMSSMIKQNADNAEQAKTLTAQAKQIVDKVDGQMKNMVNAIQEVTRSSEETGKIIKTIDEIAFQTNLLALNAAVEAARAGEAGAGFAVVADEVRNLAMRAAEAAKSTSGLIENTIVTVKNSSELTGQTQNAFRENIEISTKIGQLIDEIAAASSEQAQGIGQIGKAVAEMDKVVQGTAASAEESASAAEEMNAQAVQMKGYVEKMAEIIDGGSKTTDCSEKSVLQNEVRPPVKKLFTAGSGTPHHSNRFRPLISGGKSDANEF